MWECQSAPSASRVHASARPRVVCVVFLYGRRTHLCVYSPAQISDTMVLLIGCTNRILGSLQLHIA